MYLKISKVLKDDSYYKRGVRIALSCEKVMFEQHQVNDGGLCHGVSGIAYMFNKIYLMTNDLVFQTKSLYWYNLLFTKFYTQNPESPFLYKDYDNEKKEYYLTKDHSFLNGLSGIGLSILSGINMKSTAWDKLLLIN